MCDTYLCYYFFLIVFALVRWIRASNFLRAIIAGVTKDFGLSEVRKEYNLGSYSNITRLKTALLERDLIEKQETEWVITDPIFAKWLKQKIML